MTIGSGLGAQVGWGQESTWATPVTVDHFAPFDSETLALEKGVLQGLGLRAGLADPYSSRRQVSTRSVGGGITLDFTAKGLGLLLKHGMGSGVTAPTLVSGSAYRHVHALGSTQGYGLTVQAGRPQTDGTVRPFTYNGCKVTALEISVSDGDLVKLMVEFLGQNEATATSLATASYVATETFSFAQSAITLGGTVTTASGVASVASGTTLATLARSFSFRVERPLKGDRFGLGNAGLRGEPIENDFRVVSGTLGGEFTSRTELYDLFSADTGTALHVTFTGSTISGGNNVLDILLPAVKFNTGAVNAAGPDVIEQSLDYVALNDGTNTTAQVAVTSTDTTL